MFYRPRNASRIGREFMSWSAWPEGPRWENKPLCLEMEERENNVNLWQWHLGYKPVAVTPSTVIHCRSLQHESSRQLWATSISALLSICCYLRKWVQATERYIDMLISEEESARDGETYSGNEFYKLRVSLQDWVYCRLLYATRYHVINHPASTPKQYLVISPGKHTIQQPHAPSNFWSLPWPMQKDMRGTSFTATL